MAETVKDILRLISSSLQIPTIVILIILIIVAIIMLGSIIAEAFTERRKLKGDIPGLMWGFITRDRENDKEESVNG